VAGVWDGSWSCLLLYLAAKPSHNEEGKGGCGRASLIPVSSYLRATTITEGVRASGQALPHLVVLQWTLASFWGI
jgi:hypothetical protein